jgi:hypothetical protein
MRKCICGMLMLAAVAGSALYAEGQVAGSRPKAGGAGHPAQAVRLPYTVEYKISTEKTAPNGATITHEYTEVRSLDSEGRSMAAKTNIPMSGDETVRTHVGVIDPVARTTASWDSPGQTATVTKMAAPGTHRSCPPVAPRQPTAQLPKPVIEDLGTETIQGVEARGRRTTTTIPAGSLGSDAPLTRTDEEWTAVAPGLRGLLVRRVFDDPQSEKLTKELVNLNQSEPDAAAFQPPAGYEIVEKSAPLGQCAAALAAPVPAPSPQ